MRNFNLAVLLSSLLAIGLSADERDPVAGTSLTPEQKTALAAVDVRLAAVETLAAKIDDPDYKREVARQIEELQKRRLEV